MGPPREGEGGGWHGVSVRGAGGRPDLAWWQREGGRREGRDRPGLTRARGCQGEGGAGGGELGGAAWAEGRGAGAGPELCDRGLAAAEEAEELAEAGGPVSEAARDNRLSGGPQGGPALPATPSRRRVQGKVLTAGCEPSSLGRIDSSLSSCGGEGRGRGPSSRWGGWRPAPGLRPPPHSPLAPRPPPAQQAQHGTGGEDTARRGAHRHRQRHRPRRHVGPGLCGGQGRGGPWRSLSCSDGPTTPGLESLLVKATATTPDQKPWLPDRPAVAGRGPSRTGSEDAQLPCP